MKMTKICCRSKRAVVVIVIVILLQITISSSTTDCGKELIGMKGRITSPGYPNKYPNNLNCTWVIRFPVPDHEIILKIQTLDVEPRPLCDYDYIQVGSGTIPGRHQILRRLCGSMKPGPLKSSSGSMWLRFVTDQSKMFKGFLATWKVKRVRNATVLLNSPIKNKCGDTNLNGKEGALKSPRFPRKYPYDLRCVWLISVPERSDVVIRFEYFDLESASRCRFDYLAIQDGATESSATIGKFCGSSKPATITTTGNTARLEFRSDSSIVRGGFLIRWSSTEESVDGGIDGAKPTTAVPPTTAAPICGGQYTDEHGQLQSPSYPDFYQEDTECTWVISVRKPLRIRLLFDEEFDLEPAEVDDCIYDYVVVRDGARESDKEIGRFCGRNSPSTLTSYSSSLHITFRSDKSRVGKGFRVSWVTYDDGEELTTTSPTTTPKCGGRLTGMAGAITSPGYPFMYPPNQRCVWLLSILPGNHIRLSIDFFHLEVDANCVYDYVLVRDGTEPDSPVLGRFCGRHVYTKNGGVYSSGNSLRVEFHSDSSNSKAGFRLSWKSIVPPTTEQPFTTRETQLGPNRHRILTGCGGKFDDGFHSGTIFSPGYQEGYRPNLSCTWTVRVPYSSIVSLSFNEFELEDSTDCTSDYVIVRDGLSSTASVLGKYCGREVPVYLMSSGNELSLTLRTNYQDETKGFEISVMEYKSSLSGPAVPVGGADQEANAVQVKARCEKHFGTLIGEASIPARKDKCQWSLQAQEGNRIQLDFAHLSFDHMEFSCSEDYVEIINGLTEHAPVIGKFCSTKAPHRIRSSGRYLTVRYVMSGKVQTKLKINYEEIGNKKNDKNFFINAEDCGASSLQKEPLAGGENRRMNSKLGDWPWQAALMKSGLTTVTCGGVLIAPQWIIGAAHCFKRSLTSSEWFIKLGSVDVQSSGKFEQVFQVETVYIHPGYNVTSHGNDIALVKLNKAAELNEYVKSICLPDETNTKLYEPGTVCHAAGWGIGKTFGDHDYPLSSIVVPVVSRTECANRADIDVTNTMLCAGYKTGIDTCQGDGGGALMCKFEQRKFVAVAISSVGKGCQDYGVYTDIRPYLDWIKIQMFT